MLYILFGKQPLMIKKQINKLLKNSLEIIDEFSLNRFDYLKDDINDISLAIETIPFMREKKAVVIENANLLKTKLNEKNRIILRSLNSLDQTIDVYFLYGNDDILETNEIYVLAKKSGKIIELKSLEKNDWPKYIKKYFNDKNYQIDDASIKEINKRVNGDLFTFMNEANKLMLFCEDHQIKITDVFLLITKPLDDDVYALVNALYRHNNLAALDIFHDLEILGKGAVETLVPLLGNQFRLVKQVKFLYNQGLDYREIARQLNAHEYRIKMTLKNSSSLSNEDIDKILNNLYLIDLKTKSGLLDRSFALEIFLINFPNFNLNLSD